MRYPAEHKVRVRRKIVRAASRRFRGHGGEGVGIAELMRELKLTHGGFYRHFEDKEALFAEALDESGVMARTKIAAAMAAAAPGRELEAFITAYLSRAHCANPADGCPMAALTTEIARHPRATRAAFDRNLRAGLDAFARYLPGRTTAERERRALVLFAGLVGALNLARATADDDLRRSILEDARAFYIRAFCERT